MSETLREALEACHKVASDYSSSEYKLRRLIGEICRTALSTAPTEAQVLGDTRPVVSERFALVVLLNQIIANRVGDGGTCTDKEPEKCGCSEHLARKALQVLGGAAPSAGEQEHK